MFAASSERGPHAVEFRGIGYSVPRPEGSSAILQDLSFKVDAGETLVLLGRSGSGKTTALKMVNRLVAQNIGLVPRLEGWPAARIRTRVHELLERVDLAPGEFAGRYPRELSGGQRQRVGVARALAADPPVLLFDEPFGALDPVTRVDLQRQFLALRKTFQKTAIFVTHDVREALMLATRIGLMRAGRLEMLATPQEFVRANTEEARAFLACLEWKMDSGT
jgi:osmoprotectant transport system ATP-binding protein